MRKYFPFEFESIPTGGDTPPYTNYRTLKQIETNMTFDQKGDEHAQLDNRAANHDSNPFPTAARQNTAWAALPQKQLIPSNGETKASRQTKTSICVGQRDP